MRGRSQVVRRTPWDTPVPLYTRTSPLPIYVIEESGMSNNFCETLHLPSPEGENQESGVLGTYPLTRILYGNALATLIITLQTKKQLTLIAVPFQPKCLPTSNSPEFEVGNGKNYQCPKNPFDFEVGHSDGSLGIVQQT